MITPHVQQDRTPAIEPFELLTFWGCPEVRVTHKNFVPTGNPKSPCPAS